MLALMKDNEKPYFAHPMFWAPFVVVGEGGAGSVATAQRPKAAPAVATTPAPPTRATWARAQTRLKTLGYDPGPADGLPGSRTRKALRRYQHDQGLAANGKLDAATVAQLGLAH